MAAEITIVADEWAPYCGKPDSVRPGYGIEIAQRVFAAAGHTVIYMVVPWNRAINDTRAGKYNAIIGAYKKEAPDFVFPEEEFGVASDAFFTNRDSTWTYAGIGSLRGVVIGAIKGYSYGHAIDAYFKENPLRIQYVHGKDPVFQNLKKLLARRFDTLIADENVLMQKAREMGVADKISKAGETGVSDKLYIAFSPTIAKSQEYAEIFSSGLRKLKKSGELGKILSKYGLHYWK